MPLFQTGTEPDKPLGSEVQLETLPELIPPRHDADLDGNIVLEDAAAWAARQAVWATKRRTITIVLDDGSLMGVKETTVALPFSATAAQIQTAIDNLPTPTPGDIKVEGSGRAFTYAFGGQFANKGMKRSYSTYNLAPQVQTETVTATGGTRTLSFNGQTTGALAFGASAATVQTALEALSTIGVGNITVTSPVAGTYVYTLGGTLLGAQPDITVDPALLTGGSSTIALTTDGTTNGIRIYFETVVAGASENFQRLVKQDITSRALGNPRPAAGSGRKAPADIGNPARYNPDGSPNQR